MNNIIRFWNQNRKGIIIGLAAIVLIIVVIQMLNQIVKQQDKKAKNENKNNISSTQIDLPTESIIGEGTLSQELTENNVKIVETFIEKCNNQDITGAYEMLTDECKKTLFKTEENFKKGYYNIIFTTKRISKIENYISQNKRYTYKVSLYNDVLSTGNTEDIQSYQDYITIDENSENGKLNINSFMYREEINKEAEKDGIKVTVISKVVYKEHEDYQVKIENNTNKRISIDSREKSRSVYIVDKNNTSYSSYIHEIEGKLLQIPANMYRSYNIKFNKIYSSLLQTKSISFSDMIPDYEKYEQNKEEMKDRVKINVNI